MSMYCIEPRIDPPENPYPICPACGEECNTYYYKDGEIIGCDQCVDTKDAWEVMIDKKAQEEWRI